MITLDKLTDQQLESLKDGGKLKLQDLTDEQLEILRDTGRNVEDIQNYSFGAITENLDLKEDLIDKTTGVQNFKFRRGFANQDNEAERKAYLNKMVGEDGYTQTLDGRYALNQKGLSKIGEQGLDQGKEARLIDADLGFFGNLNPFNPDFKYDVAELTGSAGLPILATIGTGLATAGIGFIPAAGAAFLAGSIGKAVQETIFTGQDMQLQSTDEIVKDALIEGGLAMTGEGFGRALRGIFRYVFNPGQRTVTQGLIPRMLKRPTQEFIGEQYVPLSQRTPKGIFGRTVIDKIPEAQRLSEEIISGGGIPSIEQATQRPVLGRLQYLSEKVFNASPRNEANRLYMLNKMSEYLLNIKGVRLDNQIDDAFKTARDQLGKSYLRNVAEEGVLGAKGGKKALQIYSDKIRNLLSETFGESAIDKNTGYLSLDYMDKVMRESGDSASELLTKKLSSLESVAKNQTAQINTTLSQAAKDMAEQITKKRTLNPAVHEALQKGYTEFLESSNVLYNEVDNIMPRKPILDLGNVYRKAKNLQKLKFDPRSDKLLNFVVDGIENEGRSTFSFTRANSLRQTINDALYSPEFVGSTDKTIQRQLLNALDDSIDSGTNLVYLNGLQNNVVQRTLNKMPAETVDRLKDTVPQLRQIMGSKTFAELTDQEQSKAFAIITRKIDKIQPQIFEEMEKSLGGYQQATKFKKVIDNTRKAVDLKRQADKYYSTNKKAFENSLIRKLTLDAEAKGAIDPSQFVDEIVMKARPENVTKVLNALNVGKATKVEQEGVMNFLRGGALNRALNDSMDSFGDVDPTKFLKRLQRLDKGTDLKGKTTLDILFGAEKKPLMNSVEQLSKLKSSVDDEMLSKIAQGMKTKIPVAEDVANAKDFTKIINDSIDQIKQYKNKKTYLADIIKPGNDGKKALDVVFSKDGVNMIKEIKGTLTPAEMTAVREGAMSKVLSEILDETSDVGTGTILAGDKLLRAIDDKYGKATIKEMFNRPGEPIGDMLIDFAKQSSLLSKERNFAGQLVAANISLHPIKKFPTILQLNIMSKIFNSYETMRYLTKGMGTGNLATALRDFGELARIIGIQTDMLDKEDKRGDLQIQQQIMDFIKDEQGSLNEIINEDGSIKEEFKQPSQPTITPEIQQRQQEQELQERMLAQTPITGARQNFESLFPEDNLGKLIAQRSPNA